MSLGTGPGTDLGTVLVAVGGAAGRPVQVVVPALARPIEQQHVAGGEATDPQRPVAQPRLAEPGVTPLLAELSQLHGYARRFAVDVVRRPGYALRKLLPSRSHMAERYGVDPRSARLYPLYGKRLWDALTAPLRK